MEKSKKFVRAVLVVFLAAGVLALTGCRRTDDDSGQADTAVQNGISGEMPEGSDLQTDTDNAPTQDTVQEQSAETSSSIRAYSDTEIDRMIELRQSYLNGNVSPEKQVLEAEDESVVSGTLCYVKDIGRYCLPDRELTDEELLEIIEYDYTKKVALNGKTQEQMDAEDLAKELAERARLEGAVRAAGGISKEEAIEFARKAMEADIGEKAKELKLLIDRPEAKIYGWEVGLVDITDEDEYKGDIAYAVQFDKWDEMMEPEDFFSYVCYVNAIDGSISGAYSISGDDLNLEDDIVWYEH